MVDSKSESQHSIDEVKRKKHRKVSPNLGGLKFYECPNGWLTYETNLLIDNLTIEEKPPKLYTGTWNDQPVWWIESIKIYNAERAKWLEQSRN